MVYSNRRKNSLGSSCEKETSSSKCSSSKSKDKRSRHKQNKQNHLVQLSSWSITPKLSYKNTISEIDLNHTQVKKLRKKVKPKDNIQNGVLFTNYSGSCANLAKKTLAKSKKHALTSSEKYKNLSRNKNKWPDLVFSFSDNETPSFVDGVSSKESDKELGIDLPSQVKKKQKNGQSSPTESNKSLKVYSRIAESRKNMKMSKMASTSNSSISSKKRASPHFKEIARVNSSLENKEQKDNSSAIKPNLAENIIGPIKHRNIGKPVSRISTKDSVSGSQVKATITTLLSNTSTQGESSDNKYAYVRKKETKLRPCNPRNFACGDGDNFLQINPVFEPADINNCAQDIMGCLTNLKQLKQEVKYQEGVQCQGMEQNKSAKHYQFSEICSLLDKTISIRTKSIIFDNHGTMLIDHSKRSNKSGKTLTRSSCRKGCKKRHKKNAWSKKYSILEKVNQMREKIRKKTNRRQDHAEHEQSKIIDKVASNVKCENVTIIESIASAKKKSKNDIIANKNESLGDKKIQKIDTVLKNETVESIVSNKKSDRIKTVKPTRAFKLDHHEKSLEDERVAQNKESELNKSIYPKESINENNLKYEDTKKPEENVIIKRTANGGNGDVSGKYFIWDDKEGWVSLQQNRQVNTDKRIRATRWISECMERLPEKITEKKPSKPIFKEHDIKSTQILQVDKRILNVDEISERKNQTVSLSCTDNENEKEWNPKQKAETDKATENMNKEYTTGDQSHNYTFGIRVLGTDVTKLLFPFICAQKIRNILLSAGDDIGKFHATIPGYTDRRILRIERANRVQIELENKDPVDCNKILIYKVTIKASKVKDIASTIADISQSLPSVLEKIVFFTKPPNGISNLLPVKKRLWCRSTEFRPPIPLVPPLPMHGDKSSTRRRKSDTVVLFDSNDTKESRNSRIRSFSVLQQIRVNPIVP